MIREANKFDVDAIIEMLKHYREAAPLDALQSADDEEYIRRIITEIIAGMGFIFVAEKDLTIFGMLIAAKFPNIWNPKVNQCSEIAYWVEPEFRGGTAGYRLLSAYIKKCEEWKRQGIIHFCTVTKMRNSPDLKYDKFAFQKLEETWVN
jgi:GNAT superfamily N-acetyltransferase